MNNPKILLVEDDLFLKDIYADTLKNAGFELDIAEDGEQGMNKIKQGGWDLVLLDVLLPKYTGIEIVKKLKEENSQQLYKKIIFLTNMDNADEVRQMNELKIEHIIKSDYTPSAFLAKVRSYLEVPTQ